MNMCTAASLDMPNIKNSLDQFSGSIKRFLKRTSIKKQFIKNLSEFSGHYVSYLQVSLDADHSFDPCIKKDFSKGFWVACIYKH